MTRRAGARSAERVLQTRIQVPSKLSGAMLCSQKLLTDFLAAPSHDPPPPPPTFARPHMPPPSSPQQQHNHASQHAPSPFGGGRELPGIASVHRPGSGISISSLIGGGDTSGPNQPAQSQSSPPGATTSAPPANNHSMQPPSPRRAPPPGSRSEFQPFRRQPSPDRHMYPGATSRAPEAHGYPAGSPTRTYSNHGSPDQGRQSLPQGSQPYKPMVFQGSARPYASSPNEGHERDPRQSSAPIPPRPNSQPTGPPGPPPEQEVKTTYDALGGRRTIYGQPEERRRTLGESHHTRPNVTEILGGGGGPEWEW